MEIFPNTIIEEEKFMYVNKLDETRRNDSLANEAHKRWMKAQYERTIQPYSFNEGY